MQIGASENRTPYKHTILDRTLGMFMGAGSRLGWISSNLLIDACAGDGDNNVFSNTSSPAIFRRHARYYRSKPTRCFLIEQSAYAFARLQLWLESDPNVVALHGDYRSIEIAKAIGQSSSSASCFLHIDPNHANDVELAMPLRKILPQHTLCFVTLGCNAHGIKRLPTEQRYQWFPRLEHILAVMRANHDACLIRLDRDSAQWAYLITSPKVWMDRITKIVLDLGREYWAKGIELNWLSDSKFRFWSAAEKLFLTASEKEAYEQQTFL